MRNLIRVIWSLSLLPFMSDGAFSEEPLQVVSTLSSFADIAQSVGGDLIDVKYVASPRFNPHFIEPKPSDVLKLKRADLFVHGGLDLEAWRDPLVDASARTDLRRGGARQLDLSEPIRLLEIPNRAISRAEGDIHQFGNPHYWLDPRNGRVLALEIAAKLSEIDPRHRDQYARNRDAFLAELDQKIEEWRGQFAALKGKELVGYHNEWLYLMDFLGLKMEQFLEPKPGIPPTPKQIEFLTEYIRERKIPGIVQATFYPSEAAQSLAERSGAKVLLLCQNVQELPQAPNYISMIDYNISQIAGVLSHE